MDNQRLFLYLGLGFICLLIWQQWKLDEYEKNRPPQAQVEAPASADTPAITNSTAGSSSSSDVPTSGNASTASGGTSVLVTTDALSLRFSTKGGDLREAKLLNYPVSLEPGANPFLLLSDDPAEFYIAQSGLQASAGSAPDHHAIFTAEADSYTLADGQDELRVPFSWTSEDGIKVTKTYVIKRDTYAIALEYAVENNSGASWSGAQYRQLQRRGLTDDEGPGLTAYSYTGAVISTDETRYEKVDFDEMREEDLQLKTNKGWVAMIEHYFLSAWAPADEASNTIYSKALTGQNRYILGLFSASQTIEPGQTGQFVSTLYVGPKIQERLEEVAENLRLTVDFGYLTFLAEPIFWLLKWIHSFVGNWGWAIIIVTVMIKAVFYKLSEASYRSMARMRKLQPKMQELKERYGDDREKMGRATMDLYKKEKVNPLGGCFPILIQIPVFISLYWVLLESVELRQAPFLFWLDDLSVKDPFFVLPLIMGVTMFIQQKLNPAPVDPIQAKIFMAMPVVFTVFFAFFPQGLVLYWVVNNTLSIAQQYYITRHVLAEK